MATMDVTNQLVANVSSTEQSTSNVDINRSIGNAAFASNVGQFTTYKKLAAGANAISLPIIPTTEVYIKNIDSVATLTVTWTPNTGGSDVTVTVLYPGDQIILWQNPGGATAGIITLEIAASSAGYVEYFLGG
jgi:hypothetical protein